VLRYIGLPELTVVLVIIVLLLVGLRFLTGQSDRN